MPANSIHKILEDFFADTIVKEKSVGGGCIANARTLTFQSGKKVFVKSGFSNGMFLNEAHGLTEIAKAKAIRVPEVFLATEDFIAMENIEPGRKSSDFMETLGRQFAQMHRYTSEYYGFYEDNFIGSTPQPNMTSGEEQTNWITFFWNKRLKFQLQLAERNGFLTSELIRIFSQLENKIEEILQPGEEVPTLLHGDLWGGNYMHDENGNPVLIDPAVYYGHREADLAMTHLFGGFSHNFYEAYQQEFPLKEGWQYRENIYKLYHIMNHLNIFGSGYYSQCMQLINFYL